MQCPVTQTTQSALHFTLWQTSLFRHQLDFPGKRFTHISITAQRLFTTIFPPLVRYSIIQTSQGPVEVKSSVCLICMKYRLIFFNYYHYQLGSNIIIVYCKHITHAHPPPPHTHTPPSPYRYSMGLCQPTVTARSAGNISMVGHWNKHWHWRPSFPEVLSVFRIYINKMLGRNDTRTRERMYCQTIRTVRDISRDNRARIATCSLRTPTDRQT